MTSEGRLRPRVLRGLYSLAVFAVAAQALSCQPQPVPRPVILDNPAFFLPFSSLPTILFDTNKEVRITYVEYKDIAKGIINQGDDTPGFQRSTRFIFRDGKLLKYIGESRGNGKTYVDSETTVQYSRDAMVVRNMSMDGMEEVVKTKEFSVSPGRMIAKNDEGRPNYAALEFDGTTIKIWDYIDDYKNHLDKPSILISVSGSTIIASEYRRDGLLVTKTTYVDGVVRRVERSVGLVTEYSTNAGIGTVVVTDERGKLVEKGELERRVNDAGYLIYHREKFDDGRGYEFIIDYS